MNKDALRKVGYLLMVALIAAFLWSTARGALGQEHTGHPPQDMPLHEKFYSTWFMPDQPTRSCCNKADCYPTQATFYDGQWHALRREDGADLPIPWPKVEHNRDNPDGRSHICAPPPSATSYPPLTVFCFSLGGGT